MGGRASGGERLDGRHAAARPDRRGSGWLAARPRGRLEPRLSAASLRRAVAHPKPHSHRLPHPRHTTSAVAQLPRLTSPAPIGPPVSQPDGLCLLHRTPRSFAGT